MNKQMKENIQNYSNEIMTLSSFVEAVRKVPGMYIGPIGNPGFLNMIREVFQNSTDELIKHESPCDKIAISYDERSKMVMVEDNGRGIPFGRIVDIFSNQHTSSNYEKKEGEFSSGRHGVGAKVTNALSSKFIVDSYILGEAREVTFIDGIPSKDGEVVIPNAENKQGTRITFIPCFDVMGNITVTWEEVFNLVNTIFRLTPIGSKMMFNAFTYDGKEVHHIIDNANGIAEFLPEMTSSPLIAPITLSKYTGVMKADIAFVFDANPLNAECIMGFANLCPTTGGTHINGFVDGVVKYFRDYMNTIYLKNSKLSCNAADIKSGLMAVISVAHLEPNFTGQAKEVLSNEDMQWFVRTLVLEGLEEYFKQSPNVLQKLCKYFKEITEIRINETKEKVKLSTKYTSNVITGMPDKYVKSNKRKDEIHIVEGDSAMGTAKDARDKDTQAIFPIRGKIPNAFTTKREKFLANEEIASMLTIFGGGYGSKFNIDKVPWKKIVIDTDADPDGAHIRTLLLKFILLYCRPIIEDGRLYASVPPLYGVEIKNKMRYFTDEIDFIKYIQKDFSIHHTVADIKGKPLSSTKITGILYRNMNYVTELNRVSNTFAIDPYLLELILYNVDLKYNQFKKKIESLYRFLRISKKDSTIIIDGLVGNNTQTIFVNDKLLSACQPLMRYIQSSDQYYIMNGEQVSLYGFISEFNKSKPAKYTRYKGLGEMDSSQLRDSTLSYNNRTLIRYTVDSIEKEINEIRSIESNRSILLKDIVSINKSDIMN